MKAKLFAVIATMAVLLAVAGPASAQVYFSSGGYYYPSTSSYYYYPTTGYYYPMTGTYTNGTVYTSPGVVQAGTTYYTPTYGTTYQTYGFTPNNSFSSYRSGPYLDASPWGVNHGISPAYGRSVGWGRLGRWR